MISFCIVDEPVCKLCHSERLLVPILLALLSRCMHLCFTKCEPDPHFRAFLTTCFIAGLHTTLGTVSSFFMTTAFSIRSEASDRTRFGHVAGGLFDGRVR